MTEAPVAARPVEAAPETLQSLNPATGELVAEFPIDDATAVATAVGRARAALPTWRDLGFDGRRKALLRWASQLINNADELSDLVHRENGKPAEDAFLELMLTLEHIDWAAKNAKKVLSPQKVKPGLFMANHEAVIERRAYGVVGVIGPWNYPLYTPNGSIAYALAAGNTVVFKPSEYTVAIGRYYVEAFAKANPELPAGVLSVVFGYGETGAALVKSEIDKIAFTGSTPTGKRIMAAAAERMTPLVLECGGKDAAIVAADADVDAAAEAIAWSAIQNSGQTCVGTERVYVEEAVYDTFLTAIRAKLVGVAPGSHDSASYGPMTMPAQVDVVRKHIEDALSRGGRALLGSTESVRAPFIDPVVLVDTPEDSLAVTEETFGPTVTVRAVKSIDEAVELTNASEFGLASMVFSKSSGMAIARRLRAGATSVNAPLSFAAISALPFGGVGASGFGRIHGADGLREFAYPHAIARQRYAIPGMALLTFGRKSSTVAMIKKVITFRHGRHS
ncbi:aldehyde dehydrogenase family protein [Aldersonia sp. NBC_00410]|uniref:aldehyde dehydrogenase family protein n=1 Tax=Aldersonia sp. NBC_00410 TaxID=2975954 RepID=UPI002256C776|nr:aldehyde dehydrogenase family protein [Aldersonia sp. NBC_00410]MCX5044005.1 aldehyde dehydrogenase family protein [Aldersonia sp. NBC_00410]